MAWLDDLIARHPELLQTREEICRTAEAICASYRSGGKILVCGNGGSASDSGHIVGELMKSFRLERKLPESQRDLFRNSGISGWEHLFDNLQRAIPAISLTAHTALSTAVLNDYLDPHLIYAQQVYGYGKPEDTLIGISTSGNAQNVRNALRVGKILGLTTVGLTGKGNPDFDSLCDIVIHAPEEKAHLVQEEHLPIYHTICLMAEEELFGSDSG